jgi:hypothetical protein
MSLERHREEPNVIQTNLGAIPVSLELSRSTWLITSVSPGGGTKMSKHAMRGGDLPPKKWTPGYAYFDSACCGVM